MKADYDNIYGTWNVTTEGDVEGRSVNHLGTFTGYVDEIALHLADKCYYSLRFKKVDPVVKYTPKKESVSVSFDIDSGTWDTIKANGGLDEIKEAFKDRPVFISNSNYYASFMVSTTKPQDFRRQKALEKLTDEEKRLLGLT